MIDKINEFVSNHFDIKTLPNDKVLDIISFVREFNKKYGRLPQKWEMPLGIYEICILPNSPVRSGLKINPILSDIVRRPRRDIFITEE